MSHAKDFTDIHHWVERFEAPERSVWQKPAEVIAALNVRRGDRVADLGAGTGYFSVPFARAVGSKGRVYAIDLEPGMVAHIQRRVKHERAPMIVPLLGSDRAALVPEPVDLLFICSVLHHVAQRARFLASFKASLAEGGRVAILDWQKRSKRGPPRAMKISASTMIDEMRRAGFRLIERHTFLESQYFLIFRPRAS